MRGVWGKVGGEDERCVGEGGREGCGWEVCAWEGDVSLGGRYIWIVWYGTMYQRMRKRSLFRDGQGNFAFTILCTSRKTAKPSMQTE